MNQFEGNGPPPAPKEDIDSLPSVKITQAQVGQYWPQRIFFGGRGIVIACVCLSVCQPQASLCENSSPDSSYRKTPSISRDLYQKLNWKNFQVISQSWGAT